MSNHIVFVVNALDFFVSHRLQIAEEALDKGYVVSVIASRGQSLYEFDEQISYYNVPFARGRFNFFNSIYCFIKLYFILRFIKPDLLHCVTIKPIIFGGFCSLILNIKRNVFSISGLGPVFVARNIWSKFRKRLVLGIYKVIFNRTECVVIVQNLSDFNLVTSFSEAVLKKVTLIPGSGVDLNIYHYLPEDRTTKRVVLACRLIKSKGVLQFLEAAQILNNLGRKYEFLLAGSFDQFNSDRILLDDIEHYLDLPGVFYLGYVENIPDLYSSANIICLPSYYNEGVPKSLIEAAASGRAIITTDHPGCRDAILVGRSGLLVPVMDSEALAAKIDYLLTNNEIRCQMGFNGRELAVQRFSLGSVVSSHLEIYSRLIP